MIIIRYLKKIDLFGKDASLYYEKNEKRKTWIGSILTIIYIFIYILFVLYKLIRMIKKIDVVFYDKFAYIEKPPSIKLNKDNFYGGFGLEDPETYDPFIDDTIYYPKAYYKKAKRNGDKWIWEVKEVELERCSIEKFGKTFQDKFNRNALDNLYCFKEMNETLIGHFSYDEYSFFFIQLFPCINSTDNNNHCKPLDIIDYYLRGTFLCMEFEDIELTPQNYSNPTRPRNQDIYFTVGKKLFQEVHVFYQIVKVETDKDKFGIQLDIFQDLKEDEFLKYHSTYQMSNLLENDIYKTGESFCNITIKLHDQVRIQRRTYTKIFTILEDIGGFMDATMTILTFISSFPIDILYELSIVNKLFKFDLKRKLIYIKKLDKTSIPEDFRDTHININHNANNNAIDIFNSYILDNINNNNSYTNNKINMSNNSLNSKDPSIKLVSNLIIKSNKKKYIIDNIKMNFLSIFFCFFC